MMPTVGRIVHYTIPRGRGKGRVTSAEIVRVWNMTCVNLHVRLDGGNDAGMAQPDAAGNDPLIAFESSVVECSSGSPEDERLGKWFWPPRV